MMTEHEKWLPVPSWEGIYEVSNLGRVRSVDGVTDYIVKGTVRSRKKRGKVLAPVFFPNGYKYVTLAKGARREPRLVHRLVAAAFIGEPPVNQVVCHNNGIKTDNRAENLRYDWHKNNSADMQIHGTLLLGEAHRGSKLTDKDVVVIHRLRANGVGIGVIARSFGCTNENVSSILSGKTRAMSAGREVIFSPHEQRRGGNTPQ